MINLISHNNKDFKPNKHALTEHKHDKGHLRSRCVSNEEDTGKDVVDDDKPLPILNDNYKHQIDNET